MLTIILQIAVGIIFFFVVVLLAAIVTAKKPLEETNILDEPRETEYHDNIKLVPSSKEPRIREVINL